jgi:hypothetical protein
MKITSLLLGGWLGLTAGQVQAATPEKILDITPTTSLLFLYNLGESYPIIYSSQKQKNCVERFLKDKDISTCLEKSIKSNRNKIRIKTTFKIKKITCISSNNNIYNRCFINDDQKNSIRGIKSHRLTSILSQIDHEPEAAMGKTIYSLNDIVFKLDLEKQLDPGTGDVIQFSANLEK